MPDVPPATGYTARRPRSKGPRPADRVVRWDRVGRVALLAVLAIVALSYVKPLATYVQQWMSARHDRAQLQQLETDNRVLRRRAHELSKPGAIDEQARRLGMIKPGERPYVVEGPAREVLHGGLRDRAFEGRQRDHLRLLLLCGAAVSREDSLAIHATANENHIAWGSFFRRLGHGFPRLLRRAAGRVVAVGGDIIIGSTHRKCAEEQEGKIRFHFHE